MYCQNNTQQLGYSGNSTGSNGTDYHRYGNDNAIGLLDFCNNVLGPQFWALCVAGPGVLSLPQGVQEGDLLAAVGTLNPLGGGSLTPAPGQEILAAEQATDGLLGGAGLYQNQCGGLAGTGTDGEFEYGSAEAALNVRSGHTTEPVFATGAADSSGDAGVVTAGGGVQTCIGNAATAHHGGDNTIYVGDFVNGGNVGFSVYADWSPPAYLSTDGKDDNAVSGPNQAPGVSHCGDGVLDPCPFTSPDPRSTGRDSLVQDVETLDTTDATGDVTGLVLPLPNSSWQLATNLAGISACNPLDYGNHVSATGTVTALDGSGPGGTGTDPCAPSAISPNCWKAPTASLANYGQGGAEGYLFVVLDQPGVTVCYNASGGCPGTPGGDVGVTPNVGLADGATVTNVPTVGWIWTGGNFTSPGSPTCDTSYGSTMAVSGGTGTTVSCFGNCEDLHNIEADVETTGSITTSVTGCDPAISDSITATAGTNPVAQHAAPNAFNEAGVFTCTVTVSAGPASGHGGCFDPK